MQTLGPYRLLAELGRGGMGAVYRAQDSRTGEEVALKVLLDAAPNPNQLERFRREAEAAKYVQHPHLVRCLEHSFLPPRPYAVFEFVDGETLAQRVKRVGPLSWQEATGVLQELAQGVSALHAARILHRDIKPDNVILAPGGAKLADFGLAKDLDRETLTESGATLGTPGYLAPEQIGSEKERWGETTDVYGLGATLYFALTGEPPFHGKTTIATLEQVLRAPPPGPRARNPQVPEWLDALCQRCLAKLNEERPASALDLVQALRPPATRERRGGWGAAVALALAAVAVTLAALAWRSTGAAPSPDARDSVESSARRALEAAEARLSQGDASAVEDYLRALRELPEGEQAETLLELAVALRRDGRFAVGLELLERSGGLAATAQARTEAALNALGVLDVDRALSLLDEAQALEPDYGLAQEALATVWARRLAELQAAGGGRSAKRDLPIREARDRLRECVSWLDAAAVRAPREVGPAQRRASALLALRWFAAAQQEAERGLRFHPRDELLLAVRGNAQRGLAQIDAAAPYVAPFERGMERRARKQEGAERELQVALRSLPRSLPAVLACAERLVEAQEPRGARAFLERHGAEFTQASAEGLLVWAKTALFLEGGLEESLRWVDRALAQDPSFARAHAWRLQLMTLLSRRLRARVDQDPRDDRVQANLRRVREALEGYLRDLGPALERDPDDSAARQARVEILIELGRREEALADCERGLEFDPTFSPLRRLRRELSADLAR